MAHAAETSNVELHTDSAQVPTVSTAVMGDAQVVIAKLCAIPFPER